MSEYLTTKELAALLRIKERKVYDLAASGQVPCSRAHGKLLFPRKAVEAWIADSSSGQTGAGPGAASSAPFVTTAGSAQSRPSVFLGSHDPLLEWALRESACGLPSFFDGSLDGLGRFGAREGMACGLHVFDPRSAGWNITAAQSVSNGEAVVLVEWARRTRGLIVGLDAPKTVRSLSDLRGLRLAARHAKAGSQALFEHLLTEAGLALGDIVIAETVHTESEAALAVLEGKADVAFGLQSLAASYRLGFVAITDERYDLLVDRRAWFEPPMQTLLSFCRTEAFHDKAGSLAGYDISGFGQVHWNAP